jgi:alpha-L-rhamnosidase
MRVDRRDALKGALLGTGALLTGPVTAAAQKPGAVGPSGLRVCGLEAPLAMGSAVPRFSWSLDSKLGQSAYRVTVARDAADLATGKNLLWDSGRVAAPRNFDVVYEGLPLKARTQVVWRVETWPARGSRSQVSEPALFETGLGESPEWSGDWLAAETETARLDRLAGLHWISGTQSQKDQQTRYYRFVFDSEETTSAEILLSANKTESVWLNGQVINAEQDFPVSWTQMAVYPLQLRPGKNVVGVAVTRHVGFGLAPPCLASVLRYGPELRLRRSSREGWKTTLATSDGWTKIDFDDSAWESAVPATGTLPVGQPWPLYPAVYLRKTFKLDKPVRRARLYATALGAYEPWVNGKKIGGQRLAPEFTDPSKHLLYQAYDIDAFVRDGSNTLGFWVADGWYGGKYSTSGRFAFGPAPCRMKGQLEVTFEDGSTAIIATGDGWEIADSPIRSSSIYDGEVFDARLQRHDWAMPAGSSEGWRRAETITSKPVPIDPQRCPPVTEHETLRPVSIRRLAKGRYVADFGQNLAGWPRLSVTAPEGTSIEMRFAELLKPTGEIDQSNLRSAWQRDLYIAAGRGRETWVPGFTYHGFRYVELKGLPESQESWSIEAVVGHQDLAETGQFRAGDKVVDKFWRNSVWSQKSNFFGLPTDCPQRDERLGWMGDAEVFWPAASFNMDTQAYTSRVMLDMRRAQKANGAFPDVIPPFVPGMDLTSPGWADAGIVLPHTAWMQFGDTGVIDTNWAAMDKYLGYILDRNPDHLWRKARGADYGDWLAVDAKQPQDATTPKDLIGTAYWAANASMMAQMAEATGRSHDAVRYRQLFVAIKTAFNAAYVRSNGAVGNESQTSYVLAIRFGLLGQDAVLEAGRRLAADIARRGDKLSTGFLGTPHILDALALAAQERVAVTLLLQRGYPSWGYMVEKGATSMWERWNSDSGDNSMNSYNHYAFGAIGAFLFRRIAGIAAVDPGFRRVRIEPIMDARLGSAGATYLSTSGLIRTDWQVDRGRYRLDVEIPANVDAEVLLPGGRRVEARHGLNRYSGAA